MERLFRGKEGEQIVSEAKMGYARGDVVIKLVEGGRETSKEGL